MSAGVELDSHHIGGRTFPGGTSDIKTFLIYLILSIPMLTNTLKHAVKPLCPNLFLKKRKKKKKRKMTSCHIQMFLKPRTACGALRALIDKCFSTNSDKQ